MDSEEHERMRAEMQQERETRRRHMEVRYPGDRDAPSSGGIVLDIDLSSNSSTSIDMNVHELRDLIASAERFLRDYES